MNKKLRITIGVAFLLYLGFLFYKLLDSPFDNEYSIDVPEEYSALFKDSVNQKLAIEIVIGRKKRKPLVSFIYDKKYILFVSQLDSIGNRKLNDILVEKQSDFSIPKGVVYHTTGNKYITVKYFTDSLPQYDSLYLSFKGVDYYMSIKNDSMAMYSLGIGGFSIQYQKEGVRDYYVQRNAVYSKNKYVPLDVLFLRRNGKLYLLMMSINRKDVRLGDHTILPNMVK